jgi:hypothetical protein
MLRRVHAELPELLVPDAYAWREWLGGHLDQSSGVWLVLAKKGTSEPTSLTYEQALEEALCHGWIDGQVGRRDEATYRQRFTPRRRRSAWSRRNVTIAEQLLAEGADACSRDRGSRTGEGRRPLADRLRGISRHRGATRSHAGTDRRTEGPGDV